MMDRTVLSIFNKTGGQKPLAADEADVENQKLAIRAAGKARRVVKRPAKAKADPQQ